MNLEAFLPHLIELRARLVRSLIAVAAAFIGLFPFSDRVYHFIAAPLLAALPKGGHMIATGVTTPFMVPLKLTLLAALVVALPFVLYQIWAFVAPALYQHEKRLVAPLIVASTALFLCGMAFAYFIAFPRIFAFFSHAAPDGVLYAPDIQLYMDNVVTMLMAFGLTFEVPVVVVLLVKIGVVGIDKLRAARRYVIVGAFVVGAIFTPPDVLSQTMLAVPMWLLYEAGVLFAALTVKQPLKAAGDAAAPPAEG